MKSLDIKKLDGNITTSLVEHRFVTVADVLPSDEVMTEEVTTVVRKYFLEIVDLSPVHYEIDDTRTVLVRRVLSSVTIDNRETREN